LIEKELKENEKFEDQLKVGVDDILMVISEETELFFYLYAKSSEPCSLRTVI